MYHSRRILVKCVHEISSKSSKLQSQKPVSGSLFHQ